ncbi:hypothetical protein HQ36_08400 [Porphyromonas gingivicanis]|uniref:Uncharacterized protein n=1 Tax=Porphyromonas gingivicanis TaxID=266762 RepID=A0A0A2G992_9PORP|nr:hypothetical protein HQ36_08400 [Porphyromonas gingivicanis]
MEAPTKIEKPKNEQLKQSTISTAFLKTSQQIPQSYNGFTRKDYSFGKLAQKVLTQRIIPFPYYPNKRIPQKHYVQKKKNLLIKNKVSPHSL